MLTIKWKLLSEFGIIPTRATEVASGYDFRSPHDFIIKAGTRQLIATDVACQMAITSPKFDGFVPAMQLEGCSGNAYKKGLDILGGVIDNDYRGEIGVILLNTSDTDIHFSMGDKLAQAVFIPHAKSEYKFVVDNLDDTERGIKGFGSSGIAGETIVLEADSNDITSAGTCSGQNAGFSITIS